MRDKDLKVDARRSPTSWTQVNPTTWRFKLRRASSSTTARRSRADDVVFCFERASADTSQLRAYANASGIPKKIDDLTVEFTTNGPNPIELEHIVTINIMCKAWCEKNKCQKPQNFNAQGGHDHRARGQRHRPVLLKSREPDVQDGADEEPELVGLKDEKFDGNVDEIVYTPIVSDAHARRRAHLRAKSTSINDPPPQDVPKLAQTPGIKVHRGRGEPHRVHRHGPGARRAPVLERQGQEPVQGQARAPGALPGDRHRRDPQDDDARPVEAHRRDAAVAAACRRRRSRSGCRSIRARRRSCSPTPAIRTASK